MEQDKYRELFISEAREILDALNQDLVALGKDPANTEFLNTTFRHAHNLKGMSASMGYDQMSSLTHEMENILDLFRHGKMAVNQAKITLLLEACDALGASVEELAAGGKGGLGGKFKRVLGALAEMKRGDAGVRASGQALAQVATPIPEPKEEAPPEVSGKQEIRMVRVASEKLDHLMDVIGELLINKIRMRKLIKDLGHKELEESLAHMERLTGELQTDMMEIRLVPVGYIFNRFPRMVWDLAAAQHKEVELAIEGAEIGLDRTILDAMSEPLVHLLRNAVGHGIETPEARTAAGKSPSGTIRLSARREKNIVFIEISDDGRGMDPRALRQAAVERGIISLEESRKLSDEEAFLLITTPGFSTSQGVTEVSGRGVGMSTVKVAVASFGGLLSINSKPGAGSTFTLKLPLTLAILQALLVRMDNETYAIPLANISETVKIPEAGIRHVEGMRVVSYRDSVLPLVELKERIGRSHKEMGDPIPMSKSKSGHVPVVVLEWGARKVGLVVDELIAKQEVVIKMLRGPILKNSRGVTGATILGDGRVAMILDVAGLVNA